MFTRDNIFISDSDTRDLVAAPTLADERGKGDTFADRHMPHKYLRGTLWVL